MDTDLLSSISRFVQCWLFQRRLISPAVMDTNFASNVHFPLLLPLSRALLGHFPLGPASTQLSPQHDRPRAKAGPRQLHQGSAGVPLLGPMSLPLDGSFSQWELLRKMMAWPSSTSHLTKPRGGDSRVEHPSGQASLPPSCESRAAWSPQASPVQWCTPSPWGRWRAAGQNWAKCPCVPAMEQGSPAAVPAAGYEQTQGDASPPPQAARGCCLPTACSSARYPPAWHTRAAERSRNKQRVGTASSTAEG